MSDDRVDVLPFLPGSSPFTGFRFAFAVGHFFRVARALSAISNVCHSSTATLRKLCPGHFSNPWPCLPCAHYVLFEFLRLHSCHQCLCAYRRGFFLIAPILARKLIPHCIYTRSFGSHFGRVYLSLPPLKLSHGDEELPSIDHRIVPSQRRTFPQVTFKRILAKDHSPEGGVFEWTVLNC